MILEIECIIIYYIRDTNKKIFYHKEDATMEIERKLKLIYAIINNDISEKVVYAVRFINSNINECF